MENIEKSGILYIVATPIGNLEDLSLRAARILSEVDFIAAEDTRVTVKLLNHLKIKKPMISYFEHNRLERGEVILARVAAGESCALCSDAGIPAISDPGQELVQGAHEQGIRVIPIPGANAALSALCASGQQTGRFVFEGFLPMNKRARAKQLQTLAGEERTVIFYEAPHKLPQTLANLAAAFGKERQVSICRELTKIHEEILTCTLQQAIDKYTNEKPRGEFVLVVQGAPKEAAPELSLPEAAALALEYMQSENLSKSEAAKKAAAQSSFSKSEIYRQIL